MSSCKAAQCKGETQKRTRCTLCVADGNDYCHLHSAKKQPAAGTHMTNANRDRTTSPVQKERKARRRGSGDGIILFRPHPPPLPHRRRPLESIRILRIDDAPTVAPPPRFIDLDDIHAQMPTPPASSYLPSTALADPEAMRDERLVRTFFGRAAHLLTAALAWRLAPYSAVQHIYGGDNLPVAEFWCLFGPYFGGTSTGDRLGAIRRFELSDWIPAGSGFPWVPRSHRGTLELMQEDVGSYQFSDDGTGVLLVDGTFPLYVFLGENL